MYQPRSLRLMALALVALLLTSACADRKFARKYYAKAKEEGPYDCIIVTGIPYSDSTNSGLIFAARVLWAKYLYDHKIAKNIIFSGAAVSTPFYEGRAMKLLADTLGVPSEHTFAEIRAEHSTENAYYGMKMAHKLGFKKLAIAADPFQVKMLRKFLERRCDKMAMIPIIYDSVISDRRSWQKEIPKLAFKEAAADSGWVRLSDRESFGERWRGTQGKHIKYEE